jgi:hypothetical protein
MVKVREEALLGQALELRGQRLAQPSQQLDVAFAEAVRHGGGPTADDAFPGADG